MVLIIFYSKSRLSEKQRKQVENKTFSA